MKYPTVASEFSTITAAHMGFSLSRYGDGELKLALGKDAKSQRADPELAAALKRILQAGPGKCLVCIPNIVGVETKPFWASYTADRYVRLYRQDDGERVLYGSSFVTRPDSAPWIDTPDYWARVIDLWRDLDVVLVRGSTKSLTAADLAHASSVEEIVVSRQHAWADYPELLARLTGEERRVILCLGATATVLAYELAARDVQALDLGHVGMFLRKEGRFDRESFPA